MVLFRRRSDSTTEQNVIAEQPNQTVSLWDENGLKSHQPFVEAQTHIQSIQWAAVRPDYLPAIPESEAQLETLPSLVHQHIERRHRGTTNLFELED